MVVGVAMEEGKPAGQLVQVADAALEGMLAEDRAVVALVLEDRWVEVVGVDPELYNIIQQHYP